MTLPVVHRIQQRNDGLRQHCYPMFQIDDGHLSGLHRTRYKNIVLELESGSQKYNLTRKEQSRMTIDTIHQQTEPINTNTKHTNTIAASTSVMTELIPASPSLEGIPPEIRARIWELLFENELTTIFAELTPSEILLSDFERSGFNPALLVDISLTQVNRAHPLLLIKKGWYHEIKQKLRFALVISSLLPGQYFAFSRVITKRLPNEIRNRITDIHIEQLPVFDELVINKRIFPALRTLSFDASQILGERQSEPLPTIPATLDQLSALERGVMDVSLKNKMVDNIRKSSLYQAYGYNVPFKYHPTLYTGFIDRGHIDVQAFHEERFHELCKEHGTPISEAYVSRYGTYENLPATFAAMQVDAESAEITSKLQLTTRNYDIIISIQVWFKRFGASKIYPIRVLWDWKRQEMLSLEKGNYSTYPTVSRPYTPYNAGPQQQSLSPSQPQSPFNLEDLDEPQSPSDWW